MFPTRASLNSNRVFLEIKTELEDDQNSTVKNNVLDILSEIIQPNISFDEIFTRKMTQTEMDAISYTKGMVSKGKLIIMKGDLVEGRKVSHIEFFKK